MSPDYLSAGPSSGMGSPVGSLHKLQGVPVRVTRSVPNTPSRTDLSQSFEAAVHPDVLAVPLGQPQNGSGAESADASTGNAAVGSSPVGKQTSAEGSGGGPPSELHASLDDIAEVSMDCTAGRDVHRGPAELSMLFVSYRIVIQCGEWLTVCLSW